MNARDITLTAIFTSLYVTVNVVQAATLGNPTVYGPVQLRLADCLIALAALLGWPVVGGVTLGCVLSNLYAYLSPVDVVLGSIANLVSATVVFLLRRRKLLACAIGALPVGMIVGGVYLWWFFPPPDILNLSLPTWLAMMASITLSSLITITGLGSILLGILGRPGIIEPLKSRGLRVYVE